MELESQIQELSIDEPQLEKPLDDSRREHDEKVLHLLELLENYETLANHRMREFFILAHQHLGRAKFASQSQIGEHAYDLRPHSACLSTQMRGRDWVLTNSLPHVTNKKATKTEKPSATETGASTEKQIHLNEEKAISKGKSSNSQDTEVNEASEARTSALAAQTARNRRAKTMKPKEKESDIAAPRDPILQFGLLNPPQLRKAQDDFRGGVEILVQMANVKREIELLLSEIDKAGP